MTPTSGVDRHVAEAQAEALAHILAELPTKADVARRPQPAPEPGQHLVAVESHPG